MPFTDEGAAQLTIASTFAGSIRTPFPTSMMSPRPALLQLEKDLLNLLAVLAKRTSGENEDVINSVTGAKCGHPRRVWVHANLVERGNDVELGFLTNSTGAAAGVRGWTSFLAPAIAVARSLRLCRQDSRSQARGPTSHKMSLGHASPVINAVIFFCYEALAGRTSKSPTILRMLPARPIKPPLESHLAGHLD
ncbi:hypothetical protein VTO42DRAFT_3541 [Malbranchea cinnamomea]